MDAIEAINLYKEFIEKEYHATLLEQSRSGGNYIAIDFLKLSKFNIELSERLLDDPEDDIKSIELAIEQFDLPGDTKEFQIHIHNLPESSKRLVGDKRSIDFNKLLAFEGVIRAKSTVLSRVVSITFECPSCGMMIPVIQNDSKIQSPSKCGCGRKGKFKRLPNAKKIDIQKVELEELSENIKGTSQPQRLKVNLMGSLVDPKMEARFNPGAKVKVNGIMKELPIILKTGGQSIDSDFLLDAVHIENIENEEIDLNITDEEQEQIDKISNDENHIKILKAALIPSIYGYDDVKEGILVQLVGGVRKKVDDGTVKRGDVHILIIGDPGSGKSAMLQRIEKVVPHARVANGKGASGAGLTAAVIRDDFVGWTFAAGTLVLAHKSIAIIDEFDKLTKEDRDRIHEAMEQQTVTLSKANVQARLNCECSLLAGANPKYGRFDHSASTLAEQIELPPTIINRFDLIFPVKDIPEPKKDKMTAEKIFNVHTKNETDSAKLETSLLRKYLFLAKKLRPVITNEAMEKLIDYYLKLRNSASSDQGIKAVPISARQLEGLIRLSEAYAKLRLSHEVTREDAIRAINLMDSCLKQVAFDKRTGTYDVDMIATGIKTSQRADIVVIKEILIELGSEVGTNIPIQDVVEKAKKHGISEEDVDKAIEKMKRSGDAFEPRKGFVSRI